MGNNKIKLIMETNLGIDNKSNISSVLLTGVGDLPDDEWYKNILKELELDDNTVESDTAGLLSNVDQLKEEFSLLEEPCNNSEPIVSADVKVEQANVLSAPNVDTKIAESPSPSELVMSDKQDLETLKTSLSEQSELEAEMFDKQLETLKTPLSEKSQLEEEIMKEVHDEIGGVDTVDDTEDNEYDD